MAGLDASGLTVKRLDEIRTEIGDDIQASPEFGVDTNIGPDSIVGQVIEAVAVPLADNWDLLQVIYDSWDRDTAEGVQLDNLVGLTGVVREPASASTIERLEWAGVPATLVPAGTIARVPGGAQFASDADATIGGGGTVEVTATATATGPLEAAIGAVDTIVTAVVGLTGVDNLTAAIPGTDIENDPELRLRTEASFAIGGHATDQAIRARLEQIDDIQAAVVISNRALATDSEGIPGKAFRSVIWPSGLPTVKEQEIALAIFDEQPAGIFADGTEAFTVTDSKGYSQPVAFSYATGVLMWVEIDVTAGSGYQGDAAVDAAILAYGLTLSIGDNGNPTDLACYVNDNVNGVDHMVIRMQRDAPPGGGDTVPVVITFTEIALFDSARNTVTS